MHLRLHPSLRPFLKPLRSSSIPLRHFHASPHRPFLESSLGLTYSLLTELHTFTNLPWPVTLPLFALGVRFVLLPLSLKSRRIQVRMIELQPVLRAYRHFYQRQLMREKRQLGPDAIMKETTRRLQKKKREIYSRHSVSLPMRLLPLLQLPVFLVVIETIRRMCGTREGLLGLIAKQIGGSSSAETPEAVSISKDVGTGAEEGGLLSRSSSTTIEPASQTAVGLEPSFALEGGWDLLTPYPALSACLAAILYANVALPARSSDIAQDQPLLQQRVTRALKVLCLAIAPLTLQLPAAMTLYWCCSGGSALGVSLALNRLMPLPKVVVPCKINSNDPEFGELLPPYMPVSKETETLTETLTTARKWKS